MLLPVAIVALALSLTLGPMLLGNWRAQYVAQHGVPAQARILRLRETGTMYNYQPVVAFTLEVMPAGRPEYTAVANRVVTVLDAGRFNPGRVIAVKFDPTHPTRVVILDTP
jgi:hypothetical protein